MSALFFFLGGALGFILFAGHPQALGMSFLTALVAMAAGSLQIIVTNLTAIRKEYSTPLWKADSARPAASGNHKGI